MSKRPKLVIFDCDGVLVDSEGITNAVMAHDLAQYGLDVTPAQMQTEFVGGTLFDVDERLRARGVELRHDWVDYIYQKMFVKLDQEVEAIPGIEDVLDVLDANSIPYCIGSNGPMPKMKVTLGRTNLWDRFHPHIFSPHDIGMDKAKPGPGLYLHAAQMMGFAPADCVVIEDSVTGVRAAKAAKIRCFGYAVDSDPEALKAHGAHVYFDMAELPGLLDLSN